METLEELARLLRERNHIDIEISRLIGHPATTGSIGEYIASRIFRIRLTSSAVEKALDGYFTEGMLEGKTVNIKFYTRRVNLLDIGDEVLPDYYLVLTGPKSAPASSRGTTRPLVISNVYLFDSNRLVERLKSRGVTIGIATSVAAAFWEEAEIYREQRNMSLVLSDEQRRLLKLFDKL